MENIVRIQMMGNYLIYIDEKQTENLVVRTRKGAALLEYLVLNNGKPVPNQRLFRELWPGNSASNPENALKTLVSRVRQMLNQMSSGLGQCVASDRGAYRWEGRESVKVDVLELMGLFEEINYRREKADIRRVYQSVLEIYKGDLFQTGMLEGEAAYAERLHSQYLKAVYAYIELLKETEEYNEISAVCRTALGVDAFDDHLHIELMKAMVNLDRTSEALTQYKHVTNLTYRYLGTEPSEEMKEFYRQMNRSRKTLKFNLDAIRNELTDSGKEHGAFVCDYTMFKGIYNLQMRNLERLGTTMFLGVVMIGDAEDTHTDYIRQENIMEGLIEILHDHLRKGDIITHFAPTIVALLLPTVNYESGTMVLERIRQLFYMRYPNSNIPFHFRLGMLGANVNEDEDPEEGAET